MWNIPNTMAFLEPRNWKVKMSIEKEIIALPTMATRLCDNKTWDSLDVDHLRQIIYYAFLEEQKKAKDEY